MTFVESLRHCLTVKYCSVRGRASRSEYWWFMLFSSVATAVLENIPVVLWDERSTTVSAIGFLNATDTRGKKRKESVDAVAATIILEDYLRSRKNR